jgi:hypothetical protein
LTEQKSGCSEQQEKGLVLHGFGATKYSGITRYERRRALKE